MHQFLGLLTLMLSCWMITLSLVMIIFCHRKIEIIEGYLNDCRCISDARSMWGNGIIGRQMRMNMVTVVLTFPHLMYRRGDITINANLKVPKNLRTWVLWLYVNLTTLFACMIGLYPFIE
jgi:hypothetical protein